MLSSETNGQKSQPAGLRTRDGRLWFPTTRGVAIFDPAAGLIEEVPPRVVLEEIRADNQSVAKDSWADRVGAELPPGRGRVLEFHYTAPSFIAPDRVCFRYRLEGYDSDWQDVGTRRVAYYTQLRPGRYVFRVRAANHHGVWDEPAAGFAFRLAPRFYQTSRFYLALGLLSVGSVYGVYRVRWAVAHRFQRLERQLAVERERTRIARDLHDDVGASLTQIGLVTELARRKLEASHPAWGEVERVARTTQQATQAVDEIVWAINPQDDTLRSLLAYVRTFAGEFLEAASLGAEWVWPVEVPDRVVSAETRHHAFLATKEALNNAVQHAGARRVTMRAGLEGDVLRIGVADGGNGFSPEVGSGSGNGLHHMRQRLVALGGRLEILSAPGAGTRVRFAVPLVGDCERPADPGARATGAPSGTTPLP